MAAQAEGDEREVERSDVVPGRQLLQFLALGERPGSIARSPIGLGEKGVDERRRSHGLGLFASGIVSVISYQPRRAPAASGIE